MVSLYESPCSEFGHGVRGVVEFVMVHAVWSTGDTLHLDCRKKEKKIEVREDIDLGDFSCNLSPFLWHKRRVASH